MSKPQSVNCVNSLTWAVWLVVVRLVSSQVDAQVINEVLPNPSDPQDAGEWIELYNPSDRAVDLEGLLLDDIDGNSTGPFELTGLQITPKGFLVIEKSLSKLQLNNSGDQVRLISAEGSLIDLVEFGSLPTDHSYARGGDGEGKWKVTDKPTKNASNEEIGVHPTNQDTKPVITKLHISEIFPCPENGQPEWIELYNPTDQVGYVELWYLKDAADNRIPLTGQIDAKALKVIEWARPVLNNDQDTVHLYQEDTLKDSVSFDSCRSGHSFINHQGTWMMTDTPTPGEENHYHSQGPVKPAPALNTPTHKPDAAPVSFGAAVPDKSPEAAVSYNVPTQVVSATRSGSASIAGIINIATSSALIQRHVAAGSSLDSTSDAFWHKGPLMVTVGAGTSVGGLFWLRKKRKL